MGKGAVEKRVSVAYRVILDDSYDVLFRLVGNVPFPRFYAFDIRFIAIFGTLPYRGLYDT